MSPFLKGLLSVLGGIVLLVVLALAVIAWRFDPNDYKAEIQAEVKKNSGRELNLSGPLSLSLFPWLGVQAEQLSLANADGFSDAQMVGLSRLELRLKLLPLLKGEIELGKVVLHGLTVNLERRADGSSNWDDLGGSDKPVETGEEKPAAGSNRVDLGRFSIAGLDIVDARLNWRDGDSVSQIDGLNLQTGVIEPGVESNIALQVAVSLADQMRLELKMDADWTFALSGPSFALDDLRAELKASGAQVPRQSQTVLLGLSGRYDGGLQRIDVLDGVVTIADQQAQFSAVVRDLNTAMNSELDVRIKGMNLAEIARQLALELPVEAAQWPQLDLVWSNQLELAAQRVPKSKLDLAFGALQLSASAQLDRLQPPQGQGELRIAPLDLHAFLNRLGISLAGPTPAASTHLDARWQLRPNGVSVNSLKGVLAGEPISGSLSLTDFKAPALRADLDLGGITLAHWQPAESASPKPTDPPEKGGQTAINEIQVPMDWAEDLNLTARVLLRRLNAYGVRFSNVLWTADARPGTPVRQRLSAQAYGGELALDNQIDAARAEPDIGLQLTAKAIGLGELLKDGWGQRWVTGTTELGMALKTRGNTVGAIRSATNGDASYRLRDGSVQGVSLLDVMRSASAKLGGSSHKAAAKETAYDEIFGRAVIESGKVKLKELGGDSSWFRLAGDGVIDLLGGNYDLRLRPVLQDSAPVRKDALLSRLIGLSVPISVSGPLNAPRFSVDLEALAKEQAKGRLDQKKEEAKERLDEKKEELREKINEKLGDFLRSR